MVRLSFARWRSERSGYLGQHVGVANDDPVAVRFFLQNRQRITSPRGRGASRQRGRRHQKMVPAPGPVSPDRNLPNIRFHFNADLLYDLPEALGKRLATPHWKIAGCE